MKEIEPKLANELLDRLQSIEDMSDMFHKQNRLESNHLSVSCAVFECKVHLMYHMNYQEPDNGK